VVSSGYECRDEINKLQDSEKSRGAFRGYAMQQGQKSDDNHQALGPGRGRDIMG